jgi:type VI secretion system protein ImpL
MGPVLKWVLVGLVLVLVISADILLVMKMEWPWWMFLVVLLAVIAAIIVVVLAVRGVRALLRKRAENKAAGQASGATAQGLEIQQRRRNMQTAWADTIKQLRKAKLRTPGNPITTAPWYLMIGPPGAGKTTAIKNSRMAMPFTEVIQGFRKAPGFDSGEWYFLDDAILIDTPGYFVTQSTPSDGQAWHTLLQLIRKTRNLPALNGVVVCVPANALLSGGPQLAHELGINLRQRLGEVMRVLGVRCPVYLLVTHCDQIHGMTRFFQSFPDTTFSQAMGSINAQSADAGAPARFVDATFAQLREELGRLRMVILGSKYAPEMETQALLFPEEFYALKSALSNVARAAFEPGQQTETPFLRGLYFCSAHQEGIAASAFMERLGFGAERQSLSTANLSLFLRDFFGRILQQDRNLVAPTRTAVVLARFTQNLGLATWAVAMLVIGILLSVSFARNLTLTRTTFSALPSSTKVSSELGADLATLDGLRVALGDLVTSNRNWWLPRLGLRQSIRAQEQMQTIYTARYRKTILGPADRALDAALGGLTAASPPELTAGYIDLIAQRIKILQAALRGELASAAPGTYLAPNFSALHGAFSVLAVPDTARTMGTNYFAYVDWLQDPRVLEQALADDKQRIRTVLTREGIGLHWLTDWANIQESLPQVAGRDFWGAELDGNKKVHLRIGKAYSPQGWDAIRQLLADIEAANPGDEVMAVRREEYKAAYRTQYFKAWQEFIVNFNQGAGAFTSREQRMQMVARLVGKESPYTRFLAEAESALQPPLELADKPEQVPDWARALLRYQKLNDPDYQKQIGGGPGVLDKLASKGGKVVKTLKSALQGSGDEKKQLEQDQKALPHVLSYHETLKKIAESVQAPQAAFQLAKDVAIEAESVVGEPKQAMNKNVWDQARIKEYAGHGTPSENIFWQLVARPGEHVWAVLLREAEAQIQKQWAADVIAQGTGLSGWELVDAMQGFSGKVWEFQKNALDPFLRNAPGKGYEPRVLYGASVNFSPGFFSLLNRGRVGKDALNKPYAVQISALPTDANPEATKKPHETRLMLQCTVGNQELVNHNFPIKKTIQWTPQGCTDVTIEVYVGDAILKRIYSGHRGFLHFLAEFNSGRLLLRASDFPEQAGVLSGYKIRNVTVAYTFSGHDGALRLAGTDSSVVPERIIAVGE